MNRILGTLLLALALTGLPPTAPAQAQDPHSPKNREACTFCHAKQPRSLEDTGRARPLQRETVHALCTGCHEWSPERDHPVGRQVPKEPDPASLLPTDERGLMDCLTCHMPHRIGPHKALLRMKPDVICRACHANK